MNKAFLQQLTPSQRQAVLHIEGPLLVLAGPGSGKTRVITSRIAALIDSGIRPHNICAITFTNKAAEQMRQRAFGLGDAAGAHISTFHSLCVRILRQYAAGRREVSAVRGNFSIYNDAEQLRCIKRAVKDCSLDTTNFPPARMLDAISALKNRLVGPDSLKAEADDFFSNVLSKIYARYQHILTENNALDFDDLLLETARLLADFPDICNQLANRFRFLLIDEYQDTNYAQYRIARLLVSSHDNICVTGDPDQSIYRWRGADIRNILDFEKDWPDAAVVKLEENFRSTPNILEAADNLIAVNQNRKQKKLVPTKDAGSDVSITIYEDELDEAECIAEKIAQLRDAGLPLKDMAVFYRVNAASRILEEALIKNNIPYQIVRGTEFYSRKEIRDILAYLKVLVNPDDRVALLRIINTPARGIGKTTIDRVGAYAASHNIGFFDALKKAGHIESLSTGPKARIAAFVDMLGHFKIDSAGEVAPVARRIFTESGLQVALKAAGETGQTALENVNELLNAAARYDRQIEQPSLTDYLQQISLFSDTDAYDAASDRLSLMTLHSAKGLEFETVFIVGLEDGLLPHERSDTDDMDDLEEERRLFFVGITRAKTDLYISYARYRTIRGQLLRTIPSPFLYELGIDFTGSTAQESCYYDTDDIDDDIDRAVPDFVTGQLVRHDIFGCGRVRQFVNMGQSSIVIVRFNTGQTKSLMVKYANLVKL